MSGYWNGDEWRWQVAVLHGRGFGRGPGSIQVIERAEPRPEPKGARKVPFGFGPREDIPVEPLLWEGDDG